MTNKLMVFLLVLITLLVLFVAFKVSIQSNTLSQISTQLEELQFERIE